MQWLTENWVIVLFGAGMLGMHFFGHGRGHGGGHVGGNGGGCGHSKHGSKEAPNKTEIVAIEVSSPKNAPDA
jgi:hypothetical protein